MDWRYRAIDWAHSLHAKEPARFNPSAPLGAEVAPKLFEIKYNLYYSGSKMLHAGVIMPFKHLACCVETHTSWAHSHQLCCTISLQSLRSDSAWLTTTQLRALPLHLKLSTDTQCLKGGPRRGSWIQAIRKPGSTAVTKHLKAVSFACLLIVASIPWTAPTCAHIDRLFPTCVARAVGASDSTQRLKPHCSLRFQRLKPHCSPVADSSAWTFSTETASFLSRLCKRAQFSWSSCALNFV